MTPLVVLMAASIAVATAIIARADSTDDQICQQSTQFGLSPDQITTNLHNGQPNMPEFRQRGEVLNALGGCDQP
ncbi:hypothetical protein [Mycobacterium sp.]|uniref:hypothetical protein n=1 Tax=Mycobacterium sp. TaxID=1785 RepID=UPI003BAF404E